MLFDPGLLFIFLSLLIPHYECVECLFLSSYAFLAACTLDLWALASCSFELRLVLLLLSAIDGLYVEHAIIIMLYRRRGLYLILCKRYLLIPNLMFPTRSSVLIQL